MNYIFDLDETLISTTSLNNDAYNYALEKYGFNRLETNNRITREILNDIPKRIFNKIIRAKQIYFTQNWLPYRITLNFSLIEILNGYSKGSCYLWTKASKERVTDILNHLDLKHNFKKVIYDDKISFCKSMQRLKKATNSKEFIIYENDYDFFSNQNAKIIAKISNSIFEVYSYLIV